MGLSSSSLGGGRPKSRSFSASIDEPCMFARAVTLLAEREGFRPRIGAVGAVKFRTIGGPLVDVRTEERNGARSERTCMLVGRRRVLTLACADCVAGCCADDGGDGVVDVAGGEICVGNSDSRCDGDFWRPFTVDTDARRPGSTVAVSACTTGVSPGGSGSCAEDLRRLRVDVGCAFGIDGLTLSGMLNVDMRLGRVVSAVDFAAVWDGESLDGVSTE